GFRVRSLVMRRVVLDHRLAGSRADQGGRGRDGHRRPEPRRPYRRGQRQGLTCTRIPSHQEEPGAERDHREQHSERGQRGEEREVHQYPWPLEPVPPCLPASGLPPGPPMTNCSVCGSWRTSSRFSLASALSASSLIAALNNPIVVRMWFRCSAGSTGVGPVRARIPSMLVARERIRGSGSFLLTEVSACCARMRLAGNSGSSLNCSCSFGFGFTER